MDDGFAVEDTSPSSSVPVFDKPSSGTTSVSSPSSVATRFYSRKAVFAALIGLLSFFAQPVGDLLLTRSHTAQSVGIGVIQLESALPADFLIAGGGSSLFDKRASAKDLIVDCGALLNTAFRLFRSSIRLLILHRSRRFESATTLICQSRRLVL